MKSKPVQGILDGQVKLWSSRLAAAKDLSVSSATISRWCTSDTRPEWFYVEVPETSYYQVCIRQGNALHTVRFPDLESAQKYLNKATNVIPPTATAYMWEEK